MVVVQDEGTGNVYLGGSLYDDKKDLWQLSILTLDSAFQAGSNLVTPVA